MQALRTGTSSGKGPSYMIMNMTSVIKGEGLPKRKGCCVTVGAKGEEFLILRTSDVEVT